MGDKSPDAPPQVIPQQNNSISELLVPMMQMMMQFSQQSQAPATPTIPQLPQTTQANQSSSTQIQTATSDWRTIADDLAQEATAEFEAGQEGVYKPPTTPYLLEDTEAETTASLLG
jgi:hypothetical protein